MNILGTGLSGLLGTQVIDALKEEFSFTNLSLETGIDITDPKMLEKVFASSDAPWVFHFAARTDVDTIENEKHLKEQSPAWSVNVKATESIASLCKKTLKHMLYISTDYVFSGKQDRYTEEDIPDPEGFYAMTKYEGEKSVLGLCSYGLVVRIANPYGLLESGKKDFVHKIADELRKGSGINAPTDQLFVPTFIPDIASSLKLLVRENASGIYHVVGDDVCSPFQVSREIAKSIGVSDSLVHETSFASFFKGRAPRPFLAVLSNDKIKRLGIKMTSFSDGLQILFSKGKDTV